MRSLQSSSDRLEIRFASRAELGTARSRSLECHSDKPRRVSHDKAAAFVRPSQRFWVPEMLEMFLNVESACHAER
jgi:hypothetical protein